MSSFLICLLVAVAFITLTMAGLPGWCDPHHDVPGATIRPTGPVRDGGIVIITCRLGSRSAGHVTFIKTDVCIDGKWVPGITNCDDQHAWELILQPAQ